MKKKSWFYFSFWFVGFLFTLLLFGSAWLAGAKNFNGQTGIDAAEIEIIRKNAKKGFRNERINFNDTALFSG
jgi:hypothetical protein